MDIKFLSKSENKLKFLLKGINPAIANTLRRAMIAEIPILAIKEVTFTKNSSALFDEMLSHRLGLIPLKADLSLINTTEECSCKGKGCSKCQVTFTLNCEGPITVNAESLKCSDDKIKPVYGKMPIVKLLKGQELEFEAVANLGLGKVHSKYVPCLAFYQGHPKLTITKVKNSEEVVKECPMGVFDLESKVLKITNIEVCNLCGSCESIASPEESVVLEPSETDFIFTIESWGQLSPKEIYEKAIESLNAKIGELDTNLGKLK